MTDSPIRWLINASSLDTPDAARLRAATDDDTAAQIVARADGIREAIHNATPCQRWWCPTSGKVECGVHGGFDVCCNRTDLHQPITAAKPQ
jgi:hypothetical protein